MARSRLSDNNDHPVRGVVPSRETGPSHVVVVIGRPPALILWTATFLFLGFLSVLLIGVWISKFRVGLLWADPNPKLRGLMFNYHPLFMILGLLYIHGIANLMYRLFPTANYLLLRIVHGTLQLTAMTFVGLAIYAVYFYKEKSAHGHLGHFKSTHSWMGLTVLSVIGLQFLFGFFGLLVPGFHGTRREKYRALHRFTGICIFILACATALIGLDQLDMRTAIINCLAVIIILYAINGVYILTKKEYLRGGPSQMVDPNTDENIPFLAAGGH